MNITLNRLVQTFILFIIPIFFGIIAIYKGQNYSWDFRNYHLYNGYAFLNNRLTQDLAPGGMQTYFNPLVDMFYYLSLTIFGSKITAFLLGFVQGLNIFALYKISEQLLNTHRHHHLLLALISVLSVWFISEIGSIAQDSLLTIFPLYSLFLILSAIRLIDRINLPKILAGGFFTGLVCGLKLVMAPYALALSLSLLTLPINYLQRFKLFILFCFLTTIGFLVSDGYWLYKVYELTGNPLFPQFNQLFNSNLVSTAEPIIRDTRFFPRNMAEKFLYPIFFTTGPWRIDSNLRQLGWVIAYLAIIILFIQQIWLKTVRNTAPKLNHIEFFFVFYFLISYTTWQFIFSIYRYLIPLETLIPYIFVILLHKIYKNIKFMHICLITLTIITALNSIQLKFIRNQWNTTVFRLNMPELQSTDSEIVILANQPMAWIIPFLNPSASYIQLNTNFFPSSTYWLHANKLINKTTRLKYILFEEKELASDPNIFKSLNNINMKIDYSSCKKSDNFISSQIFTYTYCRLAEI